METTSGLWQALQQVIGFVYPNEIELHWNLLIVIYPYLTGLVAGAFILASLVKVFNVKDLQPTYHLSLLTAFSFLVVAPMPLLAHLSRPERGFEIFLTPSTSSAMAMFAFIYVWYLMAVLLLEIWFDYRGELVRKAEHETGARRAIDRFLALYTRDISPQAVAFDKKAVYVITVVGIPSAFLLHGYVGFIFGSIKANPWWSSVLMPIVFLFSAMVSGVALMLLIYMVASLLRKEEPDIHCLDKLAGYLFYIMIVDFALEGLDVVQRVYQSEESIKILSQLIEQRLFTSLVVVQLILGMIVPLTAIAVVKIFNIAEELRKMVYVIVALLVQVGIFATRWNVVIGGQLFSKSFRGLTAYKTALGGIDGLLLGVVFLMLPIVILYFLTLLFPPFPPKEKDDRSKQPA